MSHNTTDGINIDVVLADQAATTVNPTFYPNNIAVSMPGSAGTAGADGQDGQDGAPGTQGPVGPDGSFTPDGPAGAIQFKAVVGNTIDFSGISDLNYDTNTNYLTITGGGLLVHNANIHLSGSALDTNNFLISDSDTNVFKINTSDKKITFSEDAANDKYYLGIGVIDPSERLHIGKGNLRVDGQIKAGGHVIPLLSGQYDLGDSSHPFRDVYLEGESIHFVNSKAKITSSAAEGIKMVQTVTVNGEEEEKEILNISTAGLTFSGVMSGNMAYENITNGFLFVEKDLNLAEQHIPIPFNTTLAYDPQVVASIVMPEVSNDIYGVTVYNISDTGFYAALTAPVSQIGYTLMAFVSPKVKSNTVLV